jgi:Arc/MetJ-type ribon-helix-helix transcriptional regulator
MSGRVKTEKISITLPEDLAGEIRSLVPRGAVSSFFSEALEHYLSYRKQQHALEAGFGAWKDSRHPDLETPADSATYVRDLREADDERQERLGGTSTK